MPPTVNPARETTASFAWVSVVRIASAASAPPSAASSISPSPARSFGIGSFTPITPVERTSTSLGVDPEQASGLGSGRERVELALRARRGVRDARVDHDRLRLGLGEVRLRDEHGRGLDAVRGEHPGADGGDGRADDREVELRLADARVDGAGDEALRGGDRAGRAARCARRRRPSRPALPRAGGPAVSSRPSARFAFWTAWPGGALAEVVDRGDHDPAAGRPVLEGGDLGGVGALQPREVGHRRRSRRRRAIRRRRPRAAAGDPREAVT